jgi:hypothetical protein
VTEIMKKRNSRVSIQLEGNQWLGLWLELGLGLGLENYEEVNFKGVYTARR